MEHLSKNSVTREPSPCHTIHTHAAYDPEYKNDVFSDPDKNNAKQDGFVAYLVTPLGTIRRYNPKSEEDIPIDCIIPYDPNHPLRK